MCVNEGNVFSFFILVFYGILGCLPGVCWNFLRNIADR